MKKNILIALVVALAILAVVEAALLFGLHAPFLPEAREADDPGATDFKVVDEPFSSSRMSTSSASPLGPFASPSSTGTVGGLDPFAEMERMRREMDKRMEELMREMRTGGGTGMVMSFPDASHPAISDIAIDEKDDRYVCTLPIEGVDEESVKITVEDPTLTITGTRTIENTQEHQGRIIAHMRSTEQFSRSTALPGPVKASCMKTSFEKGVLTIDLPKSADDPISIPLPLP